MQNMELQDRHESRNRTAFLGTSGQNFAEYSAERLLPTCFNSPHLGPIRIWTHGMQNANFVLFGSYTPGPPKPKRGGEPEFQGHTPALRTRTDHVAVSPPPQTEKKHIVLVV